METITFHVPNISCMHCTMHIKNALSELDGVEDVAATVETKQVTVEFIPPATKEKIIEVLREINYPPEV
jgi:copper chaperone